MLRMLRKPPRSLAQVTLLFFFWCGLCLAQERRLILDFGYRGQTDLQGSEDLYRSHVNLGEGPKLFAFDYSLRDPQRTSLFDTLDFGLNSWGGEPYNSATLGLFKEDVYDLRFRYRNTRHFSSVPFFANPLFAGGNLESRHRLDFSRRDLSVDLELRPGHTVSPFFSFERTTRQGAVLTSLRADGDDFTVDTDLDDSSTVLRGGVNLKYSQWTFLLEQSLQWHRDRGRFSSGPQEGNSTRPLLGRDIFLDDYSAENDVNINTPVSAAAFVYRPRPGLLLNGRLTYSLSDLDSGFSEEMSGAFLAFPPLSLFYPEGLLEVSGRSRQPRLTGDVSVRWQPLPRLYLVERLRIRRSHVSGSFLATSTFPNADPLLAVGPVDVIQTDAGGRFLAVDQTTQELRGIFQIAPRLILSLGHRYERRELETEERIERDQNVLLAGFSYEFSRLGRIALDYELGRTDRPLVRTDQLDFHRLHVRGRMSPHEGLEVSGSIRLLAHDDDLESIDFTSRSRDLGLGFNYALNRRISVAGEYERSSFNTDILYTIPLTLQPDLSVYRERGHYANLLLSLLLFRESRLSAGYSAWGSVGTFPMNFHRPVAHLEVPLTDRLLAYGQWNYYGYNEKLQPFPQDYRTHLFVVGVRVTLE